MLNSGRFNIVVKSSYADLSDYNQTIKSYFEDTLSFRVYDQWTKEIRVFIKNNNVILKDNYFGYGSTSESFYSISKILTDSGQAYGTNLPIIKIRFAIDAAEDTYERSAYTIFNLISDVGGFYGMLSVFVGIFVKFFANNLFYFSVISKIYHVEDINNEVHEKLNHDSPIKNFTKVTPKSKKVKLQRSKHMVEESKYQYNPEMHKELNLSEIDDIINIQQK